MHTFYLFDYVRFLVTKYFLCTVAVATLRGIASKQTLHTQTCTALSVETPMQMEQRREPLGPMMLSTGPKLQKLFTDV